MSDDTRLQKELASVVTWTIKTNKHTQAVIRQRFTMMFLIAMVML